MGSSQGRPARAINRRRVLVGASIGGISILGGSLITACGSAAAPTAPSKPTAQSGAATQPTAASQPASGGKASIRVGMAGLDVAQIAVWQNVATEFSKANPNIEAKIENVTGDAYQKYLVEIAGNAGHDVYDYETKQVPAYGAKGVFTVLDDYIHASSIVQPNKYFPVTWSKCLVSGKVVAIPWDTTPAALFYNTEIFDKAGVAAPPHDWGNADWTWDKFREVANKLSNGEGAQRNYGYFQSTWWVYSLPWVWMNGGKIANRDETKVTIDTPEVVDAWQFLHDLMWKDKVFPSAQETTAGAGTMFFTGKIGMYTNGPYFIPSLRKDSKIKWNVAALPKGPKGLYTRDPSDSLVIWKGSKNQDQSWKFLEFATGPKGQEIIALGGRGVPARIETAQSDKFLKQPDGIDWKVFVDATAHEGIQPVTDVWPQMDHTIQTELDKMWNNRATAKDVAKTLQTSITTLLGKATARRDRATWSETGWESPKY